MEREPQVANAAYREDTWRQIEDLIDQIAALARTDVSEPDFYRALLDRAVRAGAALGGAAWSVPEDGDFRLQSHINLNGTGLLEEGDIRRRHRRLLEEVQRTARPTTALPASGDAGGTVNPTGLALFACPVTVDGRVVGVVEVIQRPDISPDAARTYAEVLTTLCDSAADFHRNSRLRELQERDSQRALVERFSREVHGDLDLDRTAYTVANEGRRLVGCDRVAVAVRRGGGFQLRAVSGLETIDRRANSVRLMERLIDHVAALDEPLYYAGDSRRLSPELEAAVQHYVDVSHARTLAVVPLGEKDAADEARDASPAIVALVFEGFTAALPEETFRQRVNAVCRHAAGALRNAVTYSRLPAVRLLARLGRLTSLGVCGKAVLWLLPVMAVLAALVFVHADFRVPCSGRLTPSLRRNVFAPIDGEVEQIHVEHGDPVTTDTILVTLRSSELEFEYTRMLGEIQTTSQQLEAVQASLLGAKPVTAEQRDEYARLRADGERLKKMLANLQEQRDVLDGQRESLAVRSPIPGEVLSWELHDTLQQRPVRRGQVLMMVADTGGPWVLELDVPDKYISYVLDAQRDLGDELDVSFALATEPGATYHGRVKRVARASEPDETRGLSVPVTVAVDSVALSKVRPGAGVAARIRCGRRALGYVWLHDLIETVRGWLFL
jgi:multidrug efflux pump subunit AcrA (membrane-fusion protein)